jgi:predicted dehydrogenase
MTGGAPMRVGIVGCGNISDIYLQNGPRFRDIVFIACADLGADAANRQAERFNIQARSVEALLKSDDVDIVLNLTIPEAHAAVSLEAIEAGKHVYSEKPLATVVAAGEGIVAAAKARGLRVGAAPDTVLGAGIQEARALIDGGAIGKPLSGLAAIMSHGMEHWHPNPGFFFRPGAGPVFDMGPYYLSTLVTLLGPVASVQATGQIGFEERIVTTTGSLAEGQAIKVETLTNVHALLEFASGAHLTFLASWDVWKHGVPPIELHGQKASLRLPDPNWFGGDLMIAGQNGEWRTIQTDHKTFGAKNWPKAGPKFANNRGLGLADMARAIIDRRPHRANGDLALHVLAVMAGILEAANGGRRVAISPSCERPAALKEADARMLLKPGPDRSGSTIWAKALDNNERGN